MIQNSAALWNRTHLDLRSDEILAQLLDRGSVDDWRALYQLAVADPMLRRRILAIVRRVPLPQPRLWLAAMRGLGEAVEWEAQLPPYV